MHLHNYKSKCTSNHFLWNHLSLYLSAIWHIHPRLSHKIPLLKQLHISLITRACLKKAFCKMCVTICGRFRPDEGAVAGYGNRIRVKYTAKWGMQIAGMIFQTRSKTIDVLTASKRILPFPGRKGGALAAGTSIIVLYVFFKDSFTSQVFRFFS